MATPSHKGPKLIVGLDYGTTYSGIAFAATTTADFRDIFTWTKFPGSASHHAEHCVKAPSRIAFKHENAGFDLTNHAWGYQVEPGMLTCSLTKLLLDRSALESEHDDPDLYLAGTGHMMRLPPGMSAKDVATAYLTGLRKMFDQALQDKFGAQALIGLPIDVWLTVPASWSEKAKLLTKTAAIDAGFASRPTDRIMLIPEPEAAAHYALKSNIHRYRDFVKPQAGVMICDCGGGTVDITSYEVKRVQPTLILREVAVGVAGKCGGTFVDRNLFKLLKRRFGEAFESLGPDQTGPGSLFMDQFELKKKDFSSTAPSRRAHRIPLVMPLLEHTPEMETFYEKRSSSILLQQDDFEFLFDPVVDAIIRLIDNQASQIKRSGDTPIETIILVGGFGSSAYLKERISKWCEPRNIRLMSPLSGGWSSVVNGAVLRGLEGSIVQNKLCRRHYGHVLSHTFNQVLHKDYDRTKRHTWTNPLSGEKMLSGFMEWEISKGEMIGKTTEINASFSSHFKSYIPKSGTHALYSCSLDTAPETIENDRIELVGTVLYDLSNVKLSDIPSVKIGGVTRYALPLLNIRLDDDKGHLVFRVLYKGNEVGHAEIDLKD